MKCFKMFALGISVLATAILGCSDAAKQPPAAPDAVKTTDAHGEWWCNEHGVPEEVCALCSSTVAEEFKAKGDWCKEHDRPDSQCFICHPDKQTEFAALYEAKYGKQPPKIEEHDDHDHGHDHDHEHAAEKDAT